MVRKKENEFPSNYEYYEQRTRGGNDDGEFSEHKKTCVSYSVAKADRFCITVTSELQCVRRSLTLDKGLVWGKTDAYLR